MLVCNEQAQHTSGAAWLLAAARILSAATVDSSLLQSACQRLYYKDCLGDFCNAAALGMLSRFPTFDLDVGTCAMQWQDV